MDATWSYKKETKTFTATINEASKTISPEIIIEGTKKAEEDTATPHVNENPDTNVDKKAEEDAAKPDVKNTPRTDVDKKAEDKKQDQISDPKMSDDTSKHNTQDIKNMIKEKRFVLNL
ncbi:hypothetical protein D3X11_04055 [Streptococcus sp. X16XC17]|uniref:hypothetical protein n=1 Tax=unclassified Streptococcus TaxID=2608887 RepID=UPI00066FD4FC|nr:MULTISPECIES: hypothetical protein [unclassified Streptococcus]TCD46570.1 hypothetical protein D3X11_04055 [Streptococcus sp. X16XC17]